ncbi:MAG TPA: ABC transporter substrate-binding protein, partial [Alphaproteobacteria bacterium]
AIPVFPSRVFRHGYIFVNKRAGIRTPKDLEGKRVGVPLYTMTAAIWQRGHLMHEYGVDLSTVRWVQGAINARTSHGTPTVLPLLKPVAIEQAQGQSLSELLDAGEIAAMLGTNPPDCFGKNPDIVRLFPNFREVERDYYTRTRIFPIMHLVVIKQEVHEKHPAVAASLYRAFCAAKDMALEKMRFTGTLRYMLPFLPDDLDEIDRVFGGDPWPYGVEPNRPTLEALVQYLAEQNVIAKPPPIESLFLPV